MKKKTKKAKRTTVRGLPPGTALQHRRAQKLAEPFIDEIQAAVDEQVEEDLGLPPQPRQRAVAFRKRVLERVTEKRKS